MIWTTSKRAEAFQQLVFSQLADYKKRKRAQGMDIIDLSVGSPDLPPPRWVMDALAEYAKDPAQYGYTLRGLEEFHEAAAAYYERRFGVRLDPETEVLQLMGSQDGLVHLPMMLAEEGDFILVPDPGYTAYETGVALSGATPYPMPLKKENHFLPDLGAIPEEVRRKAKLMILNFPGNPVPAMATRDFFAEVVRFARENGIVVVHDFAYCELVYDGRKAPSFLEVEGAKEVGVEFNSLSKSFNMAGCRIGFVVGNRDIIALLARLKSNLDYGVFAPVQKAAAAALHHGAEFLEENRKTYERRRNVLVQGLREIGWNIDVPPATMFAWAEIPAGWTSKDFAFHLIDRAGVVVTPGHAFGSRGEGYVRIALVQPESRLKEAVGRIAESGIFG